jgi:hypothetical protein
MSAESLRYAALQTRSRLQHSVSFTTLTAASLSNIPFGGMIAMTARAVATKVSTARMYLSGCRVALDMLAWAGWCEQDGPIRLESSSRPSDLFIEIHGGERYVPPGDYVTIGTKDLGSGASAGVKLTHHSIQIPFIVILSSWSGSKRHDPPRKPDAMVSTTILRQGSHTTRYVIPKMR